MLKKLAISFFVLLFIVAPALAVSQTGTFHITFDPMLGDPTEGPGPNDGWEGPDGRQWAFYPDGPDGPFWNTWWYDDPPDPLRWKEIFYDLTIEAFDPNGQQPGGYTDTVIVALNWSNMQFPATGPDGAPPSPQEEYAIERAIIYAGPVAAGDAIRVENLLNGPFVIPDFNPEWVSMDVWVEFTDPDPAVPNIIEVYGMLQHECVPEPATLGLLLVGGFLALSRKFR